MIHDLDARVRKAVLTFWNVLDQQGEGQGQKTGQKDAGRRSAVTGGKQFDGFAELIEEALRDAGVPDGAVLRKRSEVVLPGFFRPAKQWDILVIYKGALLASVEIKSHVGSFGNNANNRAEEAIGNATDYWTAVREGAFGRAPHVWLGYLMLLEDCAESRRSLSPREPHFKVFPEFKEASYIKRYELLCAKLVRERLYSGACLLVSPRGGGGKGDYSEPAADVGFKQFLAGLTAHVAAQTQV